VGEPTPLVISQSDYLPRRFRKESSELIGCEFVQAEVGYGANRPRRLAGDMFEQQSFGHDSVEPDSRQSETPVIAKRAVVERTKPHDQSSLWLLQYFENTCRNSRKILYVFKRVFADYIIVDVLL
jgi:hypothetical protein